MLKILGNFILKGLLKTATLFTPTPTSGSLWMWGYNNYGAIGDDTNISKSSPVQTIAGGTDWKQTSCGQNHTAAIKTDGTLWTWGRNYLGLLGDNTNVTYRSSPVQTITEGTDWKQVSCGQSHKAAIKTDGTLWTWGKNNAGELGDNTATNRSSPVQTVCGGTNWKQVAANGVNTAAIKTDGTLWMWGINQYGQLGDDSSVTFRSSPVQTVAFGTNWKQVSCGYTHTAAIKNDGTLWTWGINTSGELGDNTTTNKSSPIQTISFGSNWKQVACGYYNTAAIKTDGTLWTWGQNQHGQLGDNTTTNRSSPVQTTAYGTNWKQVACGQSNSAAIKTDGTLWTWGQNYKGVLGDNSIISRSSPIQTIAGGNSWIDVSANYVIAAIYQETTTPAPTCGEITSGLLSKSINASSNILVFSPDGKNCYGFNYSGPYAGKIITYEITDDFNFREIGFRLSSPVENSSSSVEISGNGQFIYSYSIVSNGGSSYAWFYVYERDVTTGLLIYDENLNQGYSTFTLPDANPAIGEIAVSFDGNFAYVTDQFNDKVNILNLKDLTISYVSCTSPRYVIISNDGKNLYVLQVLAPTQSIYCYSINQITGDLTLEYTYTVPTSFGSGNVYNTLLISKDDKSIIITEGVSLNKLFNYSRSLNDGSLTLLQTISLLSYPDYTVTSCVMTNDSINVYIPYGGNIGSKTDVFTRNSDTLLLTNTGILNLSISTFVNAPSTGFFFSNNDLLFYVTRNTCNENLLYNSGSLWNWGYNFSGLLGDNSENYKSSPVQTVANGNNWVQLSARSGIKSDGTLWNWGDNSDGGLGDNTTVNKSSPVQTITGGTNWKQVSCNSATAAIKTDGTLWCWGVNSAGQLGDNTSLSKSSPVQTVAGGTNWKQTSCGYGHTAAVKKDGTLWLWGYNFYGQLGDGSDIEKSSPVQTITGGSDWYQVSCGSNHTAAIKTDGTLWCWGHNINGQLGDDTNTWRSSPVQTIAYGTNWKQVGLYSNMSAAIKNDGTLWTWGDNISGDLGDNTTDYRSSPVQTISYGTDWKKVSGSAAIKKDGTLWTWGDNAVGELGDNTTVKRSSPVQTVASGNQWIDLQKASVTSAIYGEVVMPEYSLWAWGRNTYGVLGDNTETNRSSPVQTVSHGFDWQKLSQGYGSFTSGAIKLDGTLWMWGWNNYGQLGNNSTNNKSSPIQTVAGGTIWKEISVGIYSAAAIKNDGTLWCWGINNVGELGDNTITNRSSPVQTVAGGTNWKQISSGSSHTAAIKNDGSLWVWGYNLQGQLALNNTVNKSSPIQTISFGSGTWKQVSCGNYHTAAIDGNNRLWMCGQNNKGQLGDNTTINRSSPVQTVAGGTNWTYVSCGSDYTAAIYNYNQLWLWGSNSDGNLGDNTITDRSSPVQTISYGFDWQKVSAGYFVTGAIKKDGTLWNWGNNAFGQLGDNTTLPKSSPIQTMANGSFWLDVSVNSSVYGIKSS